MNARGISLVLASALGSAPALAQGGGPILTFTATTANVRGAPDSIRINLLRWSTDAERDQMLAAWTTPGSTAARGSAGKGRAAPAPDPSGAGNDAALQAAIGRGAGRGNPEPRRQTPEASLSAAVRAAPIAGHLWSSETAGYVVRYAARVPGDGGGERIILITDRRLGAWNDVWKQLSETTAPGYEFTLIELRLNAQGEGEGKTSLTGAVTASQAARTLALENFEALPVILKDVRRRTP